MKVHTVSVEIIKSVSHLPWENVFENGTNTGRQLQMKQEVNSTPAKTI